MADDADDDKTTHFPTVFNIAKGGLFGGYFNGASVGDANVAAVIMDYRWVTTLQGTTPATTIKYAFPQSPSDYDIFPAPNTVNPVGQLPVTEFQKAAILTSFGLISSYTGLVFEEAASGTAAAATLRFAQATGGGSHARFPTNQGTYSPSDSRDAGDNFEGANGKPPNAQFIGTDHFNTIMHELGHSIGLKHGHDSSLHGALAPQFDDNEFSVMTYASYRGSDLEDGPTEAVLGSSPQSFMMFDIAALQALYGVNFGRLGTTATYRWDGTTGQESIDGRAAPFTSTTATGKIFSTVWTQGAAATYDLSNFSQDQGDDIRPGRWLAFSNEQLAALNKVEPGNAEYLAQGNVYNSLLYQGDLRSAIVGLITGAGNDTLIGNDRDNKLIAGAGRDTITTSGGNDIVVGGADPDTFYFGPGHSIVRDTLADLNGDVVRGLGFGGVDVVDARFGWESVSLSATMATVSVGTSSFQLYGNFETGGEFMITTRGSGNDVHSAINFVNYLPGLAEGVSVNPGAAQGIANQAYLTGDGGVRFTAELKSAVSAFANTVGYYKVSADGTISDVHVLFDNSLNVAPGSRLFDIGAPANGERIGFFLIQDGFNKFGHLSGDLSFKALDLTSAANVDGGAAVLFSTNQGALAQATVFHSFAALNPNGANQTLSGIAGNHQLQIGFEDLPRASGDNDFQDVVLAVWADQDASRIL